MRPVASLCCIPSSVDARAALTIAARAGAAGSRAEPRRLHYPYYWFTFRSTVRTVLGESSTRLRCLVDARNGRLATADSFEPVSLRVPEQDVLGRTVLESEAESAAKRFAPGAFRARRRSLASVRVELFERGLVYKPFWVVASGEGSLLVDAVTGALLPLAS